MAGAECVAGRGQEEPGFCCTGGGATGVWMLCFWDVGTEFSFPHFVVDLMSLLYLLYLFLLVCVYTGSRVESPLVSHYVSPFWL